MAVYPLRVLRKASSVKKIGDESPRKSPRHVGSEQLAQFSRSWVYLNEGQSQSTRQTKRERPYDGRLVPRV
eukprot:3147447-Pleurochrysis_carterae.AAC.1